MNPIRLIALDVDGTLLNEHRVISPGVKAAIQKVRRAGIEVMLATGRHYEKTEPFLKELALQAPVVTSNGCEVREADGTLLHRVTMPLATFRIARSLALTHRVDYRAYASEAIFEADSFPKQAEAWTWLMLMLRCTNEEQVRRLWGRYEETGLFELTTSGDGKLDINPLGVSKASGIRLVCQRLGIRPEQVATIGDSSNDIAMLREFGLGVAMGNSPDQVKQAAHTTTLSNREDGVAVMLERILQEGLSMEKTRGI